jgi:DNA topoisomerase-1
MEGLTAKVFRTYNASYTFQEQLKNTPADGTVNEKILAYNRANREVAILCNHQRTVSKTFDNQMNRIEDKVKKYFIFNFLFRCNHSNIKLLDV